MSKDRAAKRSLFSAKLLIGILVAIFFGVSLYLRAVLPYDRIFSGDWIKFSGNDAYFYMRLVDNLVHNFPNHTVIDPYRIYPGATGEITLTFFGWLLAAITWIIGLGSPTEHTVDLVGVYFPAVLGALTVIPAYFIGKAIFNRWAGIIAAGLIAIMPGEFLGRSILGFTDHHVAETLFTAVTMMFLIMALKTGQQRQLAFRQLTKDWTPGIKPMIYSLLAGVFLGLYLLAWGGALLFVFIIAVFFVAQFIVDHLRHKSTDYLSLVGVILLVVAWLVTLPVPQRTLQISSLVIAILIPLVLNSTSWLFARKEIKTFYYPVALLGLGLAGVGILYLFDASLLSLMLKQFRIFNPTGTALTTMEILPLLAPTGEFTTVLAWGNFTTGFFLVKGWPIPGFSFIALGILAYQVVRQGAADKSLLIVWSLVILAAVLGQRRFAYYYAVNVAVLTSYIAWLILRLAGFRESVVKLAEVVGKWHYYEVIGIPRSASEKQIKRAHRELAAKYEGNEEKLKELNQAYAVLSDRHKRAIYDRTESGMGKGGKKLAGGFSLTSRHLLMALAIIVVFFMVFFPNISPAVATAREAPFVPSDAWCSILDWMRENTPEPYGDPNAYYAIYQPPPSGKSYEYPKSAYGVLAWWDYGYWITRIARRIPNANPSQDPTSNTEVARYFTSQDEDSANKIAQQLGTKYIIIDYETATSKFWAIATWAGTGQSQFFDVYHILQQDKLVPVTLFYPEYYRSLAIRLYNFEGKAVTPKRSIVISYEDKVSREGRPYKKITSDKEFPTYQDAQAYISSQKSGNFKIVSDDPFASPVPLDELKDYKPIQSSTGYTQLPDGRKVASVKVFEYTD